MSSILVLLQNVHETVHVFNMKLNYSEPKIFTGGVDVTQWNKLSKEEQKATLEKDWYLYYSFRHPKTGKLIRIPNIKGGINRFKNKAQRMKFLLKYQRALVALLERVDSCDFDFSIMFNPPNHTKSAPNLLLLLR